MNLEGQAEPITLDGKCLLMRETTLRNCEYIYGMVLYAGKDTKIQVILCVFFAKKENRKKKAKNKSNNN